TSDPRALHSFPTRRSSDLFLAAACHDSAAEARLRAQLTIWRDNDAILQSLAQRSFLVKEVAATSQDLSALAAAGLAALDAIAKRSEEHTSELQSRGHLVCR